MSGTTRKDGSTDPLSSLMKQLGIDGKRGFTLLEHREYVCNKCSLRFDYKNAPPRKLHQAMHYIQNMLKEKKPNPLFASPSTETQSTSANQLAGDGERKHQKDPSTIKVMQSKLPFSNSTVSMLTEAEKKKAELILTEAMSVGGISFRFAGSPLLAEYVRLIARVPRSVAMQRTDRRGLPLPHRSEVSTKYLPALLDAARKRRDAAFEDVSFIGLETDDWTGRRVKSLKGVEMFGITSSFSPVSAPLDLFVIEGRHTASNLAKHIAGTIEKAGIEDRVVAITTDRARNAVASIGTLEKNQFGCIGHLFHLLVLDVLYPRKKTAFVPVPEAKVTQKMEEVQPAEVVEDPEPPAKRIRRPTARAAASAAQGNYVPTTALEARDASGDDTSDPDLGDAVSDINALREGQADEGISNPVDRCTISDVVGKFTTFAALLSRTSHARDVYEAVPGSADSEANSAAPPPTIPPVPGATRWSSTFRCLKVSLANKVRIQATLTLLAGDSANKAKLPVIEDDDFDTCEVIVGVLTPLHSATIAVQTRDVNVHLPAFYFINLFNEYRRAATPGESPVSTRLRRHFLQRLTARIEQLSVFERAVIEASTIIHPYIRTGISLEYLVCSDGEENGGQSGKYLTVDQTIAALKRTGIIDMIVDRATAEEGNLEGETGTEPVAEAHAPVLPPATDTHTSVFLSLARTSVENVSSPEGHACASQTRVLADIKADLRAWADASPAVPQADFKVEDWWGSSKFKESQHGGKYLKYIVMALMAIRATSTEVERLFSGAGFVERDPRRGLSGEVTAENALLRRHLVTENELFSFALGDLKAGTRISVGKYT